MKLLVFREWDKKYPDCSSKLWYYFWLKNKKTKTFIFWIELLSFTFSAENECYISNNSWIQCHMYLKGYKDNHEVLKIERLAAINKKIIYSQSRNGIEIIIFVGICGWLYWEYYINLTTSTAENWVLAFPLGVKS